MNYKSSCIVNNNYKYAPRGYPYFGLVVEFAWSDDPESYAGGRVATGRTSHDRNFKGNDQENKKVVVWSSSLDFGRGVKTPHHKNVFC